ncbi:MAG TPA: helix-turn-helix transcriptional regulator [Bryobacteraceae bacterium]|jgi:transcriptional regulator with XRE-family HTH domain|nr:helix-turn-helix transcriptional regulator [Bryobacteraceae bacterium]
MPGQKLRRARERLGLRYRDVEEASQKISRRHASDEFSIGLSRLADIENKGTLPSLYRLYSVCAIYRLDFKTVLSWYGVDLGQLPSDAATVPVNQTHSIGFEAHEVPQESFPLDLDPSLDLTRTSFLSRHLQRWGPLVPELLAGFDLRQQRYGFIGTADWSMYPILPPGSFVQIDESKRKIAANGWIDEFERPIYFIEHRAGFRCCWVSEIEDILIAHSHTASQTPPEIYRVSEVDVIGQVIGVAMRLDQGKRRHTSS